MASGTNERCTVQHVLYLHLTILQRNSGSLMSQNLQWLTASARVVHIRSDDGPCGE